MPDPQKYWVNLPAEKLAGDVMERVDEYYRYLDTTGILRLWEKAYDYYYRAYDGNPDSRTGGEQGEYSLLFINHIRNFIQPF